MKRRILLIVLFAALGCGTHAQRAPEPRSGYVLVAQNPNDLSDKPAASSTTPSSINPTPPPERSAKPKPTLGQMLLGVIQAWVFWLTLVAMLVVGYGIALMISQLAYRHGQPDSAIGAARSGLGWGMLGAGLVPAVYVLLPMDSLWKPTWPWLWVILLFLPCFVISMFAFAHNDR